MTQREVQLKKRRKEAEKLLESRKKLVEWKKRLDEEDKQVRNLINQALNLKSATVPTQPQAQPRVASDEELERGKLLLSCCVCFEGRRGRLLNKSDILVLSVGVFLMWRLAFF